MAGVATLTKPALRKQIKEALRKMTEKERKRQSAWVTKKVLASNTYQEAEKVCLYLSMEDQEVSTDDILLDVFASGKKLFVPRYTPTGMEMLYIKSLDDYGTLPTTNWNIKQPETAEGREEAIKSGGLDLMLVPGLAFTKKGHRLGRGKGYYDTYLETYRQSASNLRPMVTVGLAFKQQIVDYIPTQDHDFTVDEVLYCDCN